MLELVLHHSYNDGLACDLSGHGNNGIPVDVMKGSGSFVNTFAFNKPDSKIYVKSSPSLQNLFLVRVTVRFFHSPTSNRIRFNLIEGLECFALSIGNDGSLGGAIYAHGKWRGVNSKPGIVKPKVWQEATLEHDGINNCKILLNGVVVAEAYNIPGPVLSVQSPYGIAIGHWPNPGSQYTFEGNIAEVKVYKYNFANEFSWLDQCCVNREALNKAYLKAVAKGWDAAKFKAQSNEFLSLISSMLYKVRNESARETKTMKNIQSLMADALLRGDAATISLAVKKASTQAEGIVDQKSQREFAKQMSDFIDTLPFSGSELVDLVKALCLDKLVEKKSDNHNKEHPKNDKRKEDGNQHMQERSSTVVEVEEIEDVEVEEEV